MADKRKPTLCSMRDIVNFMLESDNEIDLGEHLSDESNVESDWEYEEEHFQPQKSADSPPLACNSTENNVIMDDSQTYDVPSVSTLISSSNSTDNLVDTTDETNADETIDHESLQEASIESNAEDVVRLLVIEINLYAANFYAENPEASETSYTGFWQDVDEVEMRTFIIA